MIAKEETEVLRETSHSATLFTTYATWTDDVTKDVGDAFKIRAQ
jgi:hypothetical protein